MSENLTEKLHLAQLEMICRAHPEYKEGQYVLWLAFDLYEPEKFLSCDAEVKLNVGGKQKTLENIIPRRPYTNKRIWQAGLKAGRRRCFGIPVVFHTLDELNKVTSVTARWDIFQVFDGSEQTVCRPAPLLKLTQVTSVYNINRIVGSTKNRWFFFVSEDQTGRDAEGIPWRMHQPQVERRSTCLLTCQPYCYWDSAAGVRAYDMDKRGLPETALPEDAALSLETIKEHINKYKYDAVADIWDCVYSQIRRYDEIDLFGDTSYLDLCTCSGTDFNL